jgi:hypothetical protein
VVRLRTLTPQRRRRKGSTSHHAVLATRPGAGRSRIPRVLVTVNKGADASRGAKAAMMSAKTGRGPSVALSGRDASR